MKKVLAIFLSALLVCISIAPMSMAAAGPDLATRVTEGGYSETASQVAAVTTTTFTVVVKAPRGVKNLVGMNMYFEFDSSVLSVAKSGLAGTVDSDGNITPNFNGLFVCGLKSGSDNQYTMAWASNNGVSKNQAKDLVYVTFNVIDTTKTQTSLNLYVDEFRTEDGNNDNDITKTVLYENRIVNFNLPANTPPATTVTETEEGEDGETSASDINKLLQIIRDLLSGNGVTFADFADAIANMLGNAEITDIIEQLVDGDIDISEIFQQILEGLGIDFGSLEDILNKIIDFILGLFGGGSDNSTTAAGTTSANSSAGSDSTTAAGSSSGSEKTGDSNMGVALAATVCVAATAAFILTRKKKEIL